jgi:hypothetical protein
MSRANPEVRSLADRRNRAGQVALMICVRDQGRQGLPAGGEIVRAPPAKAGQGEIGPMFKYRSLVRRPDLNGPIGNRLSRSALWLTLPILGALAGCSGGGAGPVAPTVEVKGRVLLRRDRPLARGRVVFVPVDPATTPASGAIEPDGTFTLTTRAPADGAAVGRYKVRIEPATTGTRGKRPNRPEFPVKYIDEDTSALAVTIRPEPNHLDPFRLK